MYINPTSRAQFRIVIMSCCLATHVFPHESRLASTCDCINAEVV